VLFFCPRVCGGEDVDVLPQGLRKASLLKPVDVVATLVGPRHTHAVEDPYSEGGTEAPERSGPYERVLGGF
jgi:hypothetical protein